MIKQAWLDNQKQENINDFCKQHGYQEKIIESSIDDKGLSVEKEILNPESKENFIIRKFKEFYKNSIMSQRANKAAEKARLLEIDAVEKETF